MKKIAIICAMVIAGALLLYAASFAVQKLFLPKPEDMTGQEASNFKPTKVDSKPVAKGSGQLKVTGPVWIQE